ncbi:MAG TPA: UDP-N-acetylmuramate dehydrogenase, partial [Cryptosporangiaceae bacterium]|nr:UDP-N-acetylmuramate dehydrogenase [Cryptosporangiaceae bacterium]
MRTEPKAPLAPLTTLGLGGPATTLVEVADADEAVAAVRAADVEATPLLLLAGGSNVVVSDEGFDGTVVLLRSSGLAATRRGDVIDVTVAAGQDWDDVVAYAVAEGLAGIECLSGIPGSSGATPIQNVGAYGQEVAETVRSVTVYDRRDDDVVTLAPAECGFTYRHSVFKGDDRYVVLSVQFSLLPSRRSVPLRFGELTRVLGVAAGGSAPLGDVRDAVLGLRRGKGMVLDPDDPDTRSVGSFFMNPVLDADAFAALLERVRSRLGEVTPPRWEEPDGRVKTSAAWLIEHAGFAKGYGRDGVAISSKHTLALTHRGGGTTGALLGLAREVRDGVEAAFGVRLV